MVLGSAFAHGQVAQLSAAEIEMRNAAAAFATSREGSLFLLMGECGHLMINSHATMEATAKAWFDRNKPEMEAAYVWLDQYLSYLKSTDVTAFQRASNELARAQGASMLQNARAFFARKVPDIESCERAAKTFAVPQLDMKSIGLNPGYERFSEFSQTFARIRAEPSFSVPQHLKFGFDKAAQQLAGVGNMASLDAAEAAQERGDGLGRMEVFKGMADRGNGQAAQSIGVMLLNGQQVEKNAVEAYRWFYAAWSLSEMEGLNAMGVMNRDGLGVPANLMLAQSAFYLAKAAARNRAAFDRASSNLVRLEKQISAEEKGQIACMSLSELDDALRAPIRTLPLVVKGKSIANSERRLGGIVKDLSAIYQATTCR
jgi:TPR repeat protein